MRTILHISADFPDPLVPAKTRAVQNLIATAASDRHIVYSLNRVNWRHGISLLPFGDDRTAIAYGAPPYGFALARHLRPVTAAISADLRRRGIAPDLIHAHKLSVEGLVAADLAAALSCPFVASLWGDTDIKIFEAKRSLRGRYRAIAARAAALLPAAPWTAAYFQRALAAGGDKLQLLPVITQADAMLAPRPSERPKLACVFNFDSWHRKGFDILAKAVMQATQGGAEMSVDIYGQGSAGALMDMQRVLRQTGAERHVRLRGPLPHGKVQETVNAYTAFVLPTRRETYGMVHVEAVLGGAPILWSRNRGIDGYFDHFEIGYRCDPNSVEDVANGLCTLIGRERDLKASLAALQRSGAFDPLRRAGIAERYRNIVSRAAA